jgi:hypothetical protein
MPGVREHSSQAERHASFRMDEHHRPSELRAARADSSLRRYSEQDGTFTGSLSSGNPDLEPQPLNQPRCVFRSTTCSGLISVAPFHKRISNPVYTRSFVETNTIQNGRRYDRFGFTQPENADRGALPASN